jgi:hypothetical protein
MKSSIYAEKPLNTKNGIFFAFLGATGLTRLRTEATARQARLDQV